MIGAQLDQIGVSERQLPTMRIERERLLQGHRSFLYPAMRGVKAGQIIEHVALQGFGYPGLKDSLRPDFIGV